MKRLVSVLLSLLLMMVTATSALADAELDWNRSCWSKTGQETTLYEPEGEWPNIVWHTVGSLPANTYVKRHTRDALDGHYKISYYSGGGPVYAYIQMKPYPLVNAYVYVDVVQTGFGIAVVQVNDLYLQDLPALRAYIKQHYPDCRLLEDSERDNLEWGPGDSLHLKDDDSQSSNEKPAGSNSSGNSQKSGNKKPSASSGSKTTKKQPVEQLTLAISIAAGDGHSAVTVKKLGVYQSIVKLGSEELTVPTNTLIYEATAMPENALAVIYARNTGEVKLRPQKATEGRVTKCKTGRVALVIETDGEWSKIWYDGNVGYVQNKYLQFIPMAETAIDAEIGNRTAPMHLQAHSDTMVVTRLEEGATVQILSLDDQWAEVAANGYHGYVQLKYLKSE